MVKEGEKKHKISKKLEENVKYLKEELGVGKSYDAIYRDLNLMGRDFALFYFNGFVKDFVIEELIQDLEHIPREEMAPFSMEKLVRKHFKHIQVTKVDTLEDVVKYIMTGQAAILADGEDVAAIIDVRNYPSRQPEEPDIERVVRGSRDGFTETIVHNSVLIRRRIRDPKLRMEYLSAGTRSKTDILVAYIEDIANPDLVETIKTRIMDIKIDGLPMAEKSVEEYITTGNWNPLPQVRYTERPDVAAIHLLEGHVLVMVDTSPSVIIAPATYWHHLQHAEEYRQNAAVGAYLRWVRFIAILASIFVMPLWLLFVLQPELLPPALKFIGPEKFGKVPLIVQFLVAEIGLDMIRMATIHTPSPLATALGLIAAFMVGEVAINVGLFNPEVILYLAISAVGTFATPSYEMSMANRLFRLLLIIMIWFLRLPGLILGLLFGLVVLLTTKPFGIPYLWPLIPFNWKAMKSILIRSPIPVYNTRPSALKPLDRSRQPGLSPARKPMEEKGKKDKNKV